MDTIVWRMTANSEYLETSLEDMSKCFPGTKCVLEESRTENVRVYVFYREEKLPLVVKEYFGHEDGYSNFFTVYLPSMEGFNQVGLPHQGRKRGIGVGRFKPLLKSMGLL